MNKVQSWLREPNNRRRLEITLKKRNTRSKLLQKPVTHDNSAFANATSVATSSGSDPGSLPTMDPFPYGGPSCFQSSDNIQTTNEVYPLRKSFIFDSGADVHITNDINRFVEPIRPASDNNRIYIGNQSIPIQGFGDAYITIMDSRTKQHRKIILKDTAYVPSLNTNIVSGYQCMRQRIFPDFEKLHLYQTQEGRRSPVANLELQGNMFVLEYQPLTKNLPTNHTTAMANSHQIPESNATAEIWHKRLGHASENVIQQLPSNARGVRLQCLPKENNLNKVCEACRLSKAKKTISRATPDPANRPFEQVCVDLMFFEKGFNGHTLAMHLYDTYSSFHLVRTGKTEKLFNEAIYEFLAIIRNQFGQHVKVLHMDNEAAFDRTTQEYIQRQGILIHASAPYTPEQNGAAERAGRTFTVIGRSLRLEAQLPPNLWPELLCCAAYIANRTPVRRHLYKTLFEIAFGSKPKLGHLRIPGCKAYVLDTNPSKARTQKFHPRAHIGYLVGYCASTIFRVWVPHLRRVIRSRDVTFDEESYFDPERPFIDTHMRQLTASDLDKLDLTDHTIVMTQENDFLEHYTPRAEADFSSQPRLTNNNSAPYATPEPFHVPRQPSTQPTTTSTQLTTQPQFQSQKHIPVLAPMMPTPLPEALMVKNRRAPPDDDIRMDDYPLPQPQQPPLSADAERNDNNPTSPEDVHMIERPAVHPSMDDVTPENPLMDTNHPNSFTPDTDMASPPRPDGHMRWSTNNSYPNTPLDKSHPHSVSPDSSMHSTPSFTHSNYSPSPRAARLPAISQQQNDSDTNTHLANTTQSTGQPQMTPCKGNDTSQTVIPGHHSTTWLILKNNHCEEDQWEPVYLSAQPACRNLGKPVALLVKIIVHFLRVLLIGRSPWIIRLVSIVNGINVLTATWQNVTVFSIG